MSKSLPNDRNLLTNPAADPVERNSALARLLADGIILELRSLVEPLINHSSELLRASALNYALQYLCLDEYVSVALRRLLRGMKDSDSLEPGMAAYALGHYVAVSGRQRAAIYRHLIHALEHSENPHVQHACYEALLRAEGDPFPNVNADFRRERDVDWAIVGALRDKTRASDRGHEREPE